ncbi:hypothetical protein ACFPRL_18760 [Pseudoclavibacter helvolus]
MSATPLVRSPSPPRSASTSTSYAPSTTPSPTSGQVMKRCEPASVRFRPCALGSSRPCSRGCGSCCCGSRSRSPSSTRSSAWLPRTRILTFGSSREAASNT